MKLTRIPQGPWANPNIEVGDHDATIVEIRKGCYGTTQDTYLQIVLWLKEQECHLVTNLYFPTGKPDAKTLNRLSALCQIVGLVPQDVRDSPGDFKGAELKVTVGHFTAGGLKNTFAYCDVERFLHSEALMAS